MYLTPRARSDGEAPHPPLATGLLDRVQDQLAILRHRELGRNIGRCDRCGKQVRSQQSFMRADGVIAHVHCRTTHRVPAPVSERAVITDVRAAVAAGARAHSARGL